MKTYRVTFIVIVLALCGLGACADAVEDATTESFTKQLQIVEFDVDGVSGEQDDLIFEDEIPDYNTFKNRIKDLQIEEIEYQIVNNVGGSGGGLVYFSEYMSPGTKRLVSQPSITGGVDITTWTPLPLEEPRGDTISYMNTLLQMEELSVYFDGSAPDVKFTARLRITLKIKAGI